MSLDFSCITGVVSYGTSSVCITTKMKQLFSIIKRFVYINETVLPTNHCPFSRLL